MTDEELDKNLIENWDYLSEKEKELLTKLGVSPE